MSAMSEQPQRRRRRRRNRRPVERQTAPPDGGDGAAELLSGEEASEGGSDSGSQEVRSEGGRGRGGGNRSSGSGSGRAQEQPRKRTIFGLPRMSFAILAGLLVALIAMVVMQQLFPPGNVTEIRGLLAYPDQGRRHLADGEAFTTYNSTPPTSGPHHDEMPPVGVFGPDEPEPFNIIPDPSEMLPLLESGGVVVYYDPAHQLAEELLAWLRLVAGNRPYLAVAPLNNLAELHDGAPIVAAAWRTLLPIDAPGPDQEEAEDEVPVWRSQLEAFLSSGEAGYYQRYVLDRDGQRRLLERAGDE